MCYHIIMFHIYDEVEQALLKCNPNTCDRTSIIINSMITHKITQFIELLNAFFFVRTLNKRKYRSHWCKDAIHADVVVDNSLTSFLHFVGIIE